MHKFSVYFMAKVSHGSWAFVSSFHLYFESVLPVKTFIIQNGTEMRNSAVGHLSLWHVWPGWDSMVLMNAKQQKLDGEDLMANIVVNWEMKHN